MVRAWVQLNNLAFDGKLSPCNVRVHTDARYRDTVGAFWVGTTPVISIRKEKMTWAYLLAVMAHEMVHQWQFEHNLPTDHGDLFVQWEAYFLDNHGIAI
jgi:hypothetical protein